MAVIAARGVADPTPAFFLAGGPGQAATEQHVAAMYAGVVAPPLIVGAAIVVQRRPTVEASDHEAVPDPEPVP